VIRLTNTHLQPIGVDIGSDSIKMLQLEVSNENLSVYAAARMDVPDEARTAPDLRMAVCVDLIKQMLRQNPFSGRSIITSLPREIVNVKNLRLPMMPASELEQAIEFEARSIFPFDTDHAQVRFLHAGEVRQGNDSKQEVIVLAVKNDDVDNFLEALNRGGAVVESIDWEPAAMYRGIERFIRRREDENEVYVLIDVGFRASQVIVGKGREISFYKPIDIGGYKLDEAVSRKLEISLAEANALRRRLNESQDEASKRDPVRQAVYDSTRSIMEELAREVSLCLRYYSVTFRGQRPSRVRLVGGEGNDTQLQSILNGALPIPSEPSRLMASVNLDRMKPADRRGSLCEWSVALGLGLKMTSGKFSSRDGRTREAQAAVPAAIPLAAQAEVVDLNRAIGRGPTNEREQSAKPEAANA
jgi:type IV pilus assembly protein PilM